MTDTASFSIGQLVRHKLFNYRGVVIDIDPYFMLTEEWYQQVAKSRPPKDMPWYHVLVDNAIHQTYVAEQNLEPDPQSGPIRHPEVALYFDDFNGEKYHLKRQTN
jgi:heat shock protein HspQ